MCSLARGRESWSAIIFTFLLECKIELFIQRSYDWMEAKNPQDNEVFDLIRASILTIKFSYSEPKQFLPKYFDVIIIITTLVQSNVRFNYRSRDDPWWSRDHFNAQVLAPFLFSAGLKTESIRKSSNFIFQWKKTSYQNNLNNIYIAFIFAFFKGYRCH